MSRYWVISPYDATRPKIWQQMWQFDLDNAVIAVGWRELGNTFGYDENKLRTEIENAYPDKSPSQVTGSFNRFWNFCHEIKPGDIVVARKGRKIIAAVGTVTKAAYYDLEKAKNAAGNLTDDLYANFIDVRWHDIPRDKRFDRIVFPMKTIFEIAETQYAALVGDQVDQMPAEEGVEDQTEFVLEKYLEDFIVSNFSAIFKGDLVLYTDPEEHEVGQQYAADIGTIDILAQEPKTRSFVVIELKKGRESDKVVGRILRYMGWVAENLCTERQHVKGMIICREPDARLSYALKMSDNVAVKYYQIDFKLTDKPVGRSG